MDRKQTIIVIIVSAIVFISLAFLVHLTVVIVNSKMDLYCINLLQRTSLKLSREFNTTVMQDRNLLAAMTQIIESNDSEQDLVDVLNAIKPTSSFITSFEYLDQDGLLLSSGQRYEDQDYLDFQEEIQKGVYLSHRLFNPFTQHYEVRQAYPVHDGDQAIGILYGVTDLTELPLLFSSELFDYQAYLYVLEGDTGDFLMDTWHKTLSNWEVLGDRKTIGDVDFAKCKKDFTSGRGGSVKLYSQTTGEVLYMYYSPTGIDNIFILITVEQGVALQEARSISSNFYLTMSLMLLIFVVYVIVVAVTFIKAYRQAKKFGLEDRATLLLNRNAFEKLEADSINKDYPSSTCGYIDVNGLHEINNVQSHDAGDKLLLLIANSLKKQFPDSLIFRIGGDEFIVLSEVLNKKTVEKKLEIVNSDASVTGNGISFGVVQRENEKGVFNITKIADELMLERKKIYHRR